MCCKVPFCHEVTATKIAYFCSVSGVCHVVISYLQVEEDAVRKQESKE